MFCESTYFRKMKTNKEKRERQQEKHDEKTISVRVIHLCINNTQEMFKFLLILRNGGSLSNWEPFRTPSMTTYKTNFGLFNI